jgi:acyl-CoA synthetase (AMP-forming)/AMP-acid ligase II
MSRPVDVNSQRHASVRGRSFRGWPVDGYELAVMDEEGRSLPTGTTGEVCVRSHYQMVGYLGDPDATAAAVDAEGWLHTGDLGELRPDGGLVIQGRKKEMYIRGGYNVYPREVEEALMEHPAVSLVAVHGIADDVLGERGCAWVVPEQGSSLEPSTLRAYCQDALTYYKVPDVIRVVDELPVTAIGKIDKLELRARAEAECSGRPVR